MSLVTQYVGARKLKLGWFRVPHNWEGDHRLHQDYLAQRIVTPDGVLKVAWDHTVDANLSMLVLWSEEPWPGSGWQMKEWEEAALRAGQYRTFPSTSRGKTYTVEVGRKFAGKPIDVLVSLAIPNSENVPENEAPVPCCPRVTIMWEEAEPTPPSPPPGGQPSPPSPPRPPGERPSRDRTGTLEVECDVPAKIYVDGIYRGRRRVTLTVRAGTHEVRATYGKHVKRKSVYVRRGATTTVLIRFSEKKSTSIGVALAAIGVGAAAYLSWRAGILDKIRDVLRRKLGGIG